MPTNLWLIQYQPGSPHVLVDESGTVVGVVKLHKTSSREGLVYLHDFSHPSLRYRSVGKGRVVLDPE
jgi:hypothetical protein